MTTTNTQSLAPQEEKAALSQRFVASVMKEVDSIGAGLKVSDRQKRLIQNYFIKLDQSLFQWEAKRLRKSEKYREKMEFAWKNVNMNALAMDCASFALVGLDPLQKNHVALVPFANSSTGKIDVALMPEYRGIELKARKYGLDIPDNVVVELIRLNDVFDPIKKDVDNPSDNYRFKWGNVLDRGHVIGGFYFHEFIENPAKNKLVYLTLSDLEKRKPKHASAEFWGGEKDEYGADGNKTGKKEVVPGWRDEMLWKTIYRAAYNSITIDSEKIDLPLSVVENADMVAHTIDVTHTVVKSKELPEKKPLGIGDIENIIDLIKGNSTTLEAVESEYIVTSEQRAEIINGLENASGKS